MKPNKTKEQFIKLRAEGFSYQDISNKLNTSKQTLINWSKELNTEIGNEKSLEIDKLLFYYKTSKIERIKYLSTIHNKLKQELENRKFDTLSTTQLIKLSTLTLYKITKEVEDLHLIVEKDLSCDFSTIMGFDNIKI